MKRTIVMAGLVLFCLSGVSCMDEDKPASTEAPIDGSEIRDYSGCTALHRACRDGELEVVKELLSSGNVDVNAVDDRKFTPLHWACRRGHTEIVKELLKSGKVDVNAVDSQGCTPLHRACALGRLEIVRELLSSGKVKDINVRNNGTSTPLHRACIMGHLEVVKELLKSDKIDVNAENGLGKTPLQVAKNDEIRQILIQAGAEQ